MDDQPRCPVCSVSVLATAARPCRCCGVLYHRDCWEWVGTCSIFGCEGGPAGRGRPVRQGPPPAFSLRRFLLHNVIVMVVPVVLWGLVILFEKLPPQTRRGFDLAQIGGAICGLYLLIGAVFDRRHPLSFEQRRGEDRLIKVRMILSGFLICASPAGWVLAVALQLVWWMGLRDRSTASARPHAPAAR